MKLTCPCIHLNGTNKQDLMDALECAYSSIQSSLDALSRTAPNGRDYYVYAGQAFEQARQEHQDRMHRLSTILTEIEYIVMGIDSHEQFTREIE